MNFVMYRTDQPITKTLTESKRMWQDEQNHFVLMEGFTLPSNLKSDQNMMSLELESIYWLELFRMFSEEGLVRDVKFDSDVVTSRTHTFSYHMNYKKTDELLKALKKLMFVQPYTIEALILKMSHSNGEILFEINSDAEMKVALPASLKNDPSADLSAVYNMALRIYGEVARVLSTDPTVTVEFKER